MDLLNILHDVKVTCNECGSNASFGELLVSDTDTRQNGKKLYFIIGILEGYDSYSGKKAKCPNCGEQLNWLAGDAVISQEAAQVIKDVKDWLNKL